MRFFQRRAGMLLLLLALAIAPAYALAQDNNTINAAGSGIAATAFQTLATASGVSLPLNVTINGTTEGVNALCNSTADIALTNRPLNESEAQACAANSVDFVEVLLGYDATAFITASSNAYVDCLTNDTLNTIFAPSAVGQTTDWSLVNPGYPANPVTVVLPQANSFAYARLDSLTAGEGFRTDAQILADDSAVIAAVAANPDALGVVNLSSLSDADSGVKAISYENVTLNTCVTPSQATIEDRTYPLSNRLFAYVNAAKLETPGLRDLLVYAVGDTADELLVEKGFLAPSEATYTQLREIVNAGTTGRVFSKDVIAFVVAPDLNGSVNIGGAAQFYNYISRLQQNLAQTTPGLTLSLKLDGVPAGARKLCNGEIEIMASYSDLTDEQKTNCNANNVSTTTFEIGKQAVVLVANGNSPYLSCLTTAQLPLIFGAQVELPTTWQRIDPANPETPILLFTTTQGDDLADLLLLDATGKILPIRDDTESDDTATYRAAATANVEGALTYMTWAEYQQVLANNQERIQLVSIDSGAGCVAPSLETFKDGTYPLTRSVQLIVSNTALQSQAVQSLLWLIFSDENFSLLENSGYVGLAFGDLPNIRDSLQSIFVAADAAAAAAAALGGDVITDSPVTDEPRATEETSATEEVAATEDATATDEATATEETAATEDATATEETVATDEATATEETAATEDATATEETAP